MAEFYPQFRYQVNRSNGVIWNGRLSPTRDSPDYAIRIVHNPDRIPRVYVESPRLLPGAPHIYRDGCLCLYWPVEWRWTPQESLADTMVPWTALWLYYYEIWQITGQWYGPSSPHGPSKEPQRDD